MSSTFEELSGHYQRLLDLLRAHGEAVHRQEMDRAAALLPLIEKHSTWLAKDASLGTLNPRERSRLKQMLLQLRGELQVGQEGWQRQRQRLLKEQEQLQAARRFVHEVGRRRQSTPRYLDQQG